MFQKFGSNLPQSLIDAASSITEAKVEPAKPDAEAIARRKRLQALKDKQEDDAAEKSYKSDTGVRKVAGSSYGGAKQKDDIDEDWGTVNHLASTLGPHAALAGAASGAALAGAAGYAAKKYRDWRAKRDQEKQLKTSRYMKNESELDIVEFVEYINEMDESELDEMINEVLGKSAKAGDWIHDFVHSDNPKFAGKSKAQRKKMALAAYYGKQRNEGWEPEDEPKKPDTKDDAELKNQAKGNTKALAKISTAFAKKKVEEALKGNQHKIDTNKNGKVDAHDFKLLRAKKKVNEDVELELVLDLTEGKEEDDVPFDADKKPKKSAIAGKQGYGVSVAHHLARLGLKNIQKKKKDETYMGKAATSEEVVDERVMTPGTGTSPDPLVARTGISRDLKKPAEKDRAVQNLKTAIKSTVKNKEHGKSKLPEETEIEESRGHKIIARKLADIDRRSSGIAPDYHDNPQSTSDKLKDQHNINKVEIVTQKDTSASSQKPDVSHMDDKQLLNKKRHGYGNVVHNEETELDESDYPKMTPEVKKQVAAHLKKGDHEAAKRAASKAGYGEHFNTIHRGAVNSFHSEYDTKPSSHSDVHPFMLKHLGEQVELDEVSTEMLGRYSDKANKEYNSPDGKKKEQRKKGLITAYLKAKGRARVPATYKEDTDLEESVFLVVHHGHDDPQYRMPKGKRVLNHSTKYQNSATKSAEHLKSKGFHDVQITKDGKPFTEETELDETAALDQYIKSMGYDPEHTPKDKKVMFSKTNAFKTWATSRSRQESKSPGQEDDVHMSPGATARE